MCLLSYKILDCRYLLSPSVSMSLSMCFSVLQIKWRSRTGRSAKWSRRLQRWWRSAPACHTWLRGPRYLSISPSCSTLSATCWIHERWCTSVWKNKEKDQVDPWHILSLPCQDQKSFFCVFFFKYRTKATRWRRLRPVTSGHSYKPPKVQCLLLHCWC